MASGERTYTGSRLQKLGARTGLTAILVRVPDQEFAAELADAGVEVLDRDAGTADLVFLGVASLDDLEDIATMKKLLPPAGALWVIRPKGRGTPVPEMAAHEAGLAAGLVDVKVVSFSETHSAFKFVYRLRDR